MIEKMNSTPIRTAAGRACRKTGMLVTALALAFIFTAGLTWNAVETVSAAEPEKQTPAQTDFQRLEGKWVRPDGGYILELRNIKKDGSLSAAYFNPRPIKVFRAEVKKTDGKINLFVELRDVNYPGSTYALQYDQASDRLRGTYFQAVQRQTFDIEFVRSR